MAKAGLKLNTMWIGQARTLAKAITDPIQKLINSQTTVSIERTTLRLLGVEGSVLGSDEHPMPWVNIVVEKGRKLGVLDRGVLSLMGHLMDKHGLSLEEVVADLACGKNTLTLPSDSSFGISKETKNRLEKKAYEAVKNIRLKGHQKQKRQGKVLGRQEPLRYLIVATGNIHEDVVQAQAAVQNGADIIAVIRSTAQSLLDHVPVGITTQGVGGTFATQENFRLMRQALNQTSKEVGRYIHLTNYSSGLCMPEIAAMAALEDLDMLLNDAMYGILFRDINMQRTFIDQYFSRLICSANKIYIQTGEDNYLTTADAFDSAHHVLASQFINECFALRAGIGSRWMCLGHAFEMDPKLEDGFLWEIAQAQMIRQIFPDSPLKYMPPTKHKTGDFFWSNLYDGMFNLAAILTGQTVSLLGMATESLHNPMLHDRFWSLKNANYIFNNARHLGDEIQWKRGGRMEKRAQRVLKNTLHMLQKVKKVGLMEAISRGWFADVQRHPEGGKGFEGALKKAPDYWNPVWKALEK
jgi:beta-lysine 5,6-aminomutase alpha subunit